MWTHVWMPVNQRGHRWEGDAGYAANKRLRKLFPTKKAAEEWVEAKKSEKKLRGTERVLTVDQERDAFQAFSLLPSGTTLTTTVRAWLAIPKKNMAPLTVRDAVARYLDTKRNANLRPRYVHGLENLFAAFCRSFGDRDVGSIGRDELRKWLLARRLGPWAWNNYRRDIGGLWGWLKLENVALDVERRTPDNIAPAIVLVPDAALVLAGIEAACRPALAIALFSGLRPAEVMRLDWSEIGADHIEVTARKSKTRQRRLVEILPCLRAWLDLTPAAGRTGQVFPYLQWLTLMKAATRVGVKIGKNACRHSFASYHLARFQSADRTALQLGHHNTDMLFRHYREVVTPDAALAFFSLGPPGWKPPKDVAPPGSPATKPARSLSRKSPGRKRT
jgi:integrase